MSEIKIWESSLQKGHKKLLSVYSGNAEVISKEVKAKALQELGFAYQVISENDMLKKCDPMSIINAITNVARTSISLNPVMKLAYLVPRNGKCILDFSYMGMISLLKNNGNIKTINAYIVYEDEDFEHDIVNNVINHKPKYAKSEVEHKKRNAIGAYTVAKLPSGEVDYCFMPYWEIDKVRKSSKGADSSYSPWNTWLDEMIKKTVIKRHFKMLIAINNVHDSKLNALIEIENDNNGLQDKFLKQNKNGLGNAFVKEPEIKNDKEIINERIAMLTAEHEPKAPEISAENQAIIDELETKKTTKQKSKKTDKVDDAKIVDEEKSNNLFES
jgi:recombination protein RecT